MTKYYIIPMGKPRMTRRDKWKKRPCVVAYHAFKDQCRAQDMIIPVPCKITFNMPMPSSWSQKKKAQMDGQPHLQKPDIDNLVKAVLDAVLEEDSHVWSISAEKRWSYMPSIVIYASQNDVLDKNRKDSACAT